MFKYRFFQIVMAFAVAMLIPATAIFLSFYALDTNESKYAELMGTTEDTFEGWIEYSIVADAIMTEGADFAEGTTDINDYNVSRLELVRKIRSEARRTMSLAIILLVVGFVVVRHRRLYECIIWGGIGAAVIEAASFALLFIPQSGIFYSIKQMIFYGDYTLFFSTKDELLSLIPVRLANNMFLIYAVTIAAGIILTIAVRLISWRKSRPYKF